MTMISDTVSSSSSSINGNSSPKSALGRLRRKLSPTPKTAEKPSLSTTTSRSANSTNYSTTTSPGTSNDYEQQLHRVFDYLDEDGDGKISPAELQSCVRTVGGELSTEEAEAAVSSSDMDGDGFLGFEDFQQMMEGSSSCPLEDKRDELRQAFAMYETTPGSGVITPMSLKRMLSQLGQSSSTDDCKAMIRSFDLNGDGVLSFHEFTVMMR